MPKRHSISIDINVYDRLRNTGRFGETHTDIISSLLDQVETSPADEYNAKVEGDSQT
jgi:hypothetical protein